MLEGGLGILGLLGKIVESLATPLYQFALGLLGLLSPTIGQI